MTEEDVIDLGYGLKITMSLYEQCPRTYRLYLDGVLLALGEEFAEPYTRYVSKGEKEWPILHYVAPSEKAFIDRVMNKFRANRKAKHEAEVAKFLQEAEQARRTAQVDAILAIRKFTGDTDDQ
jgi:hypothetical protein